MNDIRDAVKTYDFVGVVAYDGHEHTIKAFGNVCGTPFEWSNDELENQLIYCKKISGGQELEVIVANTVEEAVDEEILDEFDGKYYIK